MPDKDGDLPQGEEQEEEGRRLARVLVQVRDPLVPLRQRDCDADCGAVDLMAGGAATVFALKDWGKTG